MTFRKFNFSKFFKFDFEILKCYLNFFFKMLLNESLDHNKDFEVLCVLFMQLGQSSSPLNLQGEEEQLGCHHNLLVSKESLIPLLNADVCGGNC